MATTTPTDRGKPRSKRRAACGIGTAAVAMLLTLVTIPPAAAATVFKATYTISVGGVTIGTANAEGRFTDTQYATAIKGKTSGISRLVSDARAQLRGNGRISGGRLLPKSYDLETREGEFETHVRMKMGDGAISDLLVIPSLREHPDRLPLEPEHKENVVDPVAAFLAVADKPGIGDGRRICQRTVAVFDGWQRYDIRLAYKQTRKVEGSGDAYDGRVVVCTARYVPVAGHFMSRKSTRELAENKRLEVWYAPVEGRQLLVPYRMLIGTKYGDLVVVATRFVVNDPAAKPAVAN